MPEISGGNTVYRFDRPDGETEYRVFGRLDGGEPAFVPSDAQGRVTEDAVPADSSRDAQIAALGYVPGVPEDAPFYYVAVDGAQSLYELKTPGGDMLYRVYDAERGVFLPADAEGNALRFTPVDPADEEALATMGYALAPQDALPASDTLPEGYTPVEGKPGLYAFETPDGQTHTRAYATTDGETYGFLAVDADGKPLSFAFVDPADDRAAMTATPSDAASLGTQEEPPAIPAIARIDETPLPTERPTAEPTAAPTATPAPTAIPTATPTVAPTPIPTLVPTAQPTAIPTATPTIAPTPIPTATPMPATDAPATAEPSPVQKAPFPWWIILVVLVLVAIGAAVFIGVKKKK